MSVNVFTAANGKYEPFVLPYAVSILAHNPEAVVEIALEDDARFREENADALSALSALSGLADRLILRAGDFSRLPANSVRFIETPTRKADYIYIGDIDILVLEEIAPAHLASMNRTGLPYSNIKRPGKTALSGLHFSRWEAFFPHADAKRDRINLDEGYLYDLIEARGLPLPHEDEKFRPIHGFHLSLNRDPRTTRNTWGGVNKHMAEAFARFRTSELWLAVSPFFDRRYKRVLFTLEVMLAAKFPEVMETSSPTPGLSLKNEW